MIQLLRVWKELVTRLGSFTERRNTMKMRNPMRIMTKMAFNASARADAERYRRYAEAKRKIPMDISASEYEECVKALVRKFKI